jgi:hypothetical protein
MALQNLRVGNRDAGILGIMAFVAIVIYGTTEGTILGGDLHGLMYFVPTMYGTYEYWNSRGKNRAVEPVTKFGIVATAAIGRPTADVGCRFRGTEQPGYYLRENAIHDS